MAGMFKINNFNKFLLNFYRFLVVFTVISLTLSPLGFLAEKYLPSKIAEQISRAVPKIETASAHVDDVFVFITVASSSPWIVPTDWNSASNSIEVIGGGGGGGDGTNSGPGGAGGGGYSRINNLSLTLGNSVIFGVGAGGAQGGTSARGAKGGKTFFNAASFVACTDSATCVKADGGDGSLGAGITTAAIGGQISTTASAVGTTTYTGGNGGVGCAGDSGGGGGGAGGPKGNGATGGNGGGDTSPGPGGGGGGNGGGTNGSNATVACGSASGNQSGGDGGDNAYDSNSGGAGGNGGTANTTGTNGGGGGGGDDGEVGGSGGAGDEWVTGYGSGGGGGGGGDVNAGGNGGGFGGGGGGGEENASVGTGDGADGIIVIKYAPRAVQSHFQWFNDDYALDSMDNLASISAEDIKASSSEALSINSTYRLRLQVANIKGYGEVPFSADKFRLEMARAGTSCTSLSSGWDWRTVPLDGTGIASAAFDIESSGQFTDGASTSVSLLSAPAGAATFTNGYGLGTRATTGYQTIADNAFTEMEWALKPNSNANTSADYCFRAGWITDDSTTPDTRASMSYSKIASASVQAAINSTFTQNDYEWFYNADSITPGGSIAGVENSYTEIGNSGVDVRLRINITVGTGTLTAGSQQFKLQYSSGSSGPWADVGGNKWGFKENGSVADGADISNGGTFVSTSTNAARQTYQESNPTIVNPRSASVGNNIEYDWSLDSGGITKGRIYYFRMVKSDGTALDSYNSDSYPSIRIPNPVSHAGSGGGSSNSGGNGDSGGGQASVGGRPEVAGASNPGGQGDSGGGTVESGGVADSGVTTSDGGASPVIFDWWLWRWLTGK